MDAPHSSREAAAARPPGAQVRTTSQPRVVRQPLSVYIVESQLVADTIEQNAMAGGVDDEGNTARPSGPREYLIGGSAKADADILDTASYMVEMNEMSEAAGTGTIYRVIDLRRRR